MLRLDSSGKFMYEETGFFNKKRTWYYYSGKYRTRNGFEDETYKSLLLYQQNSPIMVMSEPLGKKRWWMFMGDFYCEDDGYSELEVKVLILDRIAQKKKRVQRAIARVSQSYSKSNPTDRRQPISDDVKMSVWQRDGGHCVKCQSQEKLEFDHIIPLSKGGSDTERNIQLLCEKCNRSKSRNIV